MPWDDVRQFTRVREIWTKFQTSTPQCMKTVKDLKAFASYFESQTSLEGPASSYLARKDGPMKRLRQQIAIAQKCRAAGTHVRKGIWIGDMLILPDGKITAEILARYLDEVIGIPAKTTDIENARRKKVFTPGQVPNTEEVREKLALLKEVLFPALRVEDFLAEKVALDLIH